MTDNRLDYYKNTYGLEKTRFPLTACAYRPTDSDFPGASYASLSETSDCKYFSSPTEQI